jgi:hypothetical protein
MIIFPILREQTTRKVCLYPKPWQLSKYQHQLIRWENGRPRWREIGGSAEICACL